MFGRSFRVATIAGVPVNVDASWIWIAVFITYSQWMRFQVETGGPIPGLLLAIVTASLFFGSVLLHELAHAVAARLQGITVFGITLVVFGGFTSARSDERGAGPAFLIAAVGPATSLALGAIFWGLSRSLEASHPALASGFGSVGWVNLFMAGFNILPGLPLDGGRMLQTAIWRITGREDLGTRVAARAGIGVSLLLFGAGFFEVMRGDIVAALWLGIIGGFIFQGARGALRTDGLASKLASGRVRDIIEPPPPVVPADMSLSEALDRYLRGRDGEAFPVVDGGRVLGLVSLNSASAIGMLDPLRPVRDALIPLSETLVVDPDEALDSVGTRLTGGGTALVMRDGSLLGTITGEGLLRWASSTHRPGQGAAGAPAGGVGGQG